MFKMISIGRENSIPRERILAIVYPDSSPIRTLMSEKRHMNQLIDATRGKKTRSLIILDNGFCILSSFKPDTLKEKCQED